MHDTIDTMGEFPPPFRIFSSSHETNILRAEVRVYHNPHLYPRLESLRYSDEL
jgi:hypothetical protein